MTAKKQRLVTKQDDGSDLYEFNCPYPTGCGTDPNDPDQRYRAFNYDRESAVARGKQHLAEHDNPDDVTPETHEFRVGRGLTTAGSAPVIDDNDWEA